MNNYKPIRHLIMQVLFLACFINFLPAQDNDLSQQIIAPENSTLYLLVKNQDNQLVPYADINIQEKGTSLVQKSVTDADGKVQFIVFRGKTYTIKLDAPANPAEITIPANIGYVTKNIVYSGAIAGAHSLPDTLLCQVKPGTMPGQSETLIEMHIKDARKQALVNYPLCLYCKKTQRVYTASTNEAGVALFIVPAFQRYCLNMEELSCLYEFDTEKHNNRLMERDFTYQPTSVYETVVNDTVRQILPHNATATNMRAYIIVAMKNGENKRLEDEEVCLNLIGSARVFVAKTDSDGIARFLVPIKKKYSIHFKYDRDVDVLDYSKLTGQFLQNTDITFTYKGSKKIETFYETTLRDSAGFIVAFMNSPVSRLTAFDGKVAKTKLGYNINFEKNYCPVSTPALAKNMLFTGGSLYDGKLYGFNFTDGKFKWGLELSDNGPTAITYDEETDVLLINTESCTIYAIDAIAGNLLWSNWLGVFLKSSPSVCKGKVYTSYPCELPMSGKVEKNKFAFACFDLKTGKIAWQKYIDTEILSAPVIENNRAYITTLSGALYIFNALNGNKISEINANAMTPPLIVGDKVFVTVKNKNGEEEMAVYNASDLTVINNKTGIKGKGNYKNLETVPIGDLISFNGSSITNYNDNNYNVIGNRLICSNPEKYSVLWEKELACDSTESRPGVASMPIIVNNSVIVSTSDGKLLIYNPGNGQLIKEYKTGGNLLSGPVAYKGWIYNGSSDGKIVAVNTGNAAYSGWSMWNYSGAHNRVVR